jgi:DNA modification methylase
MVTKEWIQEQKSARNNTFFQKALSTTNDERTLITALENLSKLPDGFDGNLFLPLLKHPASNIRLLSVKNLGKLKDESFFDVVCEFARCESNTLVRREAISTIGRMRTKKAIPILTEFLRDKDPKVVLQAIRALLCFKESSEVSDVLIQLAEHPNELIQDTIEREFGSKREEKSKDVNQAQSPDFLKNILVHGDVRKVLKYVPDESIHLTFTSPPYYNARDYTIYKSYKEYLHFLVSVFKEVHRITKEGRFFVLNTSPVIIPRMSRSHSSTRYLIPFDIHPLLTEIGWEFIEDIIWVKPGPSAKNRNGGFFQHRKPLGYKANSVSEYVIVYRKRTDKLIDWNMKQYPDEVVNQSKINGDYERTNVWEIAPANDKVHPAIFPKELAARVIQFYSFKGDLVFDPFAGIGTVGQAALMLERHFFLVEQEKEYVERATTLLNDGLLFCKKLPKTYYLEQFAETRFLRENGFLTG